MVQRTALLNYYSSRAVAHASFVVASVFGLVTVLGIIRGLGGKLSLLSLPIFLVFSYAGYFTLLRFGFYASAASKLSADFEINEKIVVFEKDEKTCERKRRPFKDHLESRAGLQDRLLFHVDLMRKWSPLIYWVVVLYFATAVYSTLLESPVEWMSYFVILIGLLVFFVGIPGYAYLQEEKRRRNAK